MDDLLNNLGAEIAIGISSLVAAAGAWVRHRLLKATEDVSTYTDLIQAELAEAIERLEEEGRERAGSLKQQLDTLYERTNQRISDHIESRLH